jgi:hypothetical protein
VAAARAIVFCARLYKTLPDGQIMEIPLLHIPIADSQEGTSNEQT